MVTCAREKISTIKVATIYVHSSVLKEQNYVNKKTFFCISAHASHTLLYLSCAYFSSLHASMQFYYLSMLICVHYDPLCSFIHFNVCECGWSLFLVNSPVSFSWLHSHNRNIYISTIWCRVVVYLSLIQSVMSVNSIFSSLPKCPNSFHCPSHNNNPILLYSPLLFTRYPTTFTSVMTGSNNNWKVCACEKNMSCLLPGLPLDLHHIFLEVAYQPSNSNWVSEPTMCSCAYFLLLLTSRRHDGRFCPCRLHHINLPFVLKFMIIF